MNMSSDFRHLELATDETRMGEIFHRHAARLLPASGTLQHVYVSRVFPRGRGGFVIQYELHFKLPHASSADSQVVCAELLPHGAAWPAYVQQHPDRVLLQADLGLVVPIFPFDPELNSLADWASPDRASVQLHEALEPLGGAWSGVKHSVLSQLQVLSYRLARRCTLRYDLAWHAGNGSRPASRTVIGRLSRPGTRAAQSEAVQAAVAEGRSSRSLPESLWITPLVTQSATGVELFPLAPGKSLHELTGHPSLVPACKATGAVLAQIHSHRGQEGTRNTHSETETLRRQVALVSEIFPGLASRFREALESWEQKTALAGNTVTLIHGDFYDKQVLYSPEGVTVLDCDTLSFGDPALDVGNFCAHLTLRALQHPEDQAHLRLARGAFEEGYSAGRHESMEPRRFWEAATLLRLAALYALRPRWRRITPALLEESKQCLE